MTILLINRKTHDGHYVPVDDPPDFGRFSFQFFWGMFLNLLEELGPLIMGVVGELDSVIY
jgi:hypothetical protein